MHRRQFLRYGVVTASAWSANVADFAQGDEASVTTTATSRTLIATLSNYLCQIQSDEGRWSSRTYALLRSGQALTPFVLSALLEADANNRSLEPAMAAKHWIVNQIHDGALGMTDPDVLEYPVFASAFALRCLSFYADSEATQRVAELRKFLLEQQFIESQGFKQSDLAYGGWGFGGKHLPGQSGHMDLSHTRWVLAALATNSSSTDSRQYQIPAQRFLRLVQKRPDEDRVVPLNDDPHVVGSSHDVKTQRSAPSDGGFYFSPVVRAANKGRLERVDDRSYFRSYATATCDGVIALLAAGVPTNDERILSARRWLETNSDWDYPAGIPKDFPEPWGDAVYFYHQAVRAEAYRKLGINGDWAERLIERLTTHLQSDGSIVNQRSPLMKENDPILSSTLALVAATHAAHS
jgi:hypothetical protein